MNGTTDGLRLMIIGAHPDDPEFYAGGLATLYRQAGHHVRMIAVTDGGAGHHRLEPEDLVKVRRTEAIAAAQVIGAEYETWGFPDGALQATLEVRHRIVRAMRSFAPDLVLTHRPFDYHPDHRAVGQAVQDASYMVTVPLVARDSPILKRDPVVAYMPDLFTRPCPMVGDVVIDIGPQMETIVAMLACHESQVFDFLPYNHGVAEQVPDDPGRRIDWLRGWYAEIVRPRAAHFRASIERQFGANKAASIEFVEAFEVSEYASPLDAAARRRLFGFLADAGDSQ